MRICITLDDVIRAKTQQFGKMYKRGINPDIELDTLDMSSGNLQEIFGMTQKEYNKFLYEDYPFEIFAEAPVTEKMLDKKLNLWHIRLNDIEIPSYRKGETIELILGNTKEFNASIGYTYFFLSQIATRVRETYFPAVAKDIWNNCNVLITADPELLASKPEWGISVKIKTDYNADYSADFEYDKLADFLEDEEFFEKAFELEENKSIAAN